MQEIDQFKKIFFEECQDLLAVSENHLNALKNDTYTLDDIHAIFRSVHTIKGGAGSFGLDALVSYAHILETFLDHLRNQKITLTPEMAVLLLRANDTLADFIKFSENDSAEIPFFAKEIESQLLSHYDDTKKIKNKKPNKKVDDESCQYNIAFIPKKEIMQFGNDPLLIIRDLKKQAIKDTFSIEVFFDAMPDLQQLDCTHCYFKWNISFESHVQIELIKEAFEFVEDDCTIDIKCIPHHEKENDENFEENHKKIKMPKRFHLRIKRVFNLFVLTWIVSIDW
jgi:two-component system chemotaxis sensor kinase CheA